MPSASVEPRALVVPTNEPIRLMDVTDHHCRWIAGDVNGPDTLFCAAPKEPTETYCSFHSAKAYNSGARPHVATRPNW